MMHLSPAASGLPDTISAFSAARRLLKTQRCKMQKTTLEVVLLPKLVSTLQALITSTPLVSLPLFCPTTPLAISSVPCLLSSLNVAD